MLIDWFTVCAQVLNFLILVWLLHHFLYRPILAAIDAREKLIATKLADADTKEKQAQKDGDDFRHQHEEFDQARAALLTSATEAAHAEGQRLTDAARTSANALDAKRKQSRVDEARQAEQAIGQRTQQEVFAIARKALADLASADLEERIIAVFIGRLRSLDGSVKEVLSKALLTSTEPALVRTTFDLPEERRATLQKALNEAFSAAVRVRYETAPGLIAGIELSAAGQKLAWTITDYLGSLAKGVGELLQGIPSTTSASAKMRSPADGHST